MTEKERLRKQYKAKRQALAEAKRAEMTRSITQNAMDFVRAHSQFHHFHVFLPISRLQEIDTFPMVDYLLQEGKEVYTSISDFRTGALRTVALSPSTQFTTDKWGIPIPLEPEDVGTEKIEVVFVPLLACDLSGNRIGYGKGFYDRFLTSLKPEVFKVGLSYFLPEVAIEADPHDISLDICILPGGIIEF